ncbi:zinc finger MIZ domain containing protein [Naviculisporaceae sp. PSN 640]
MPAQGGPGGNRTTSSSDINIASTNATVNAFLGARQPSWLTGGGGLPKSSSRRPPSRQRPPQALSKPPAQTEPVLPSPAPSEEPSPAVSNHLDSPNPPPASLTETQNMVPPGASGSNGAPVTDARFVLDPTAEQHHALNGSGWVLGGYNGHLQSPSIASPPFSGPGPTGGVLASPHVSSAPPQLSLGQTGPNGQIQMPPQRRTDQTQFRYSTFQPHIAEYIRSCGGEQALSNEIERPRLQLLSDACAREDGFFIALHQIYMLWSSSPQHVYAVLQLPQRTADSAFAIIETVFKKNQLISTGHREWFAKFPSDINKLLQGYTQYAVAVTQVARFLEQLANHFKNLTEKSVNRKYPYLVDELLYYLACYSPVLQMIFFTASRRRLGVLDGPLGTQIEALFREDQARHVDSSTGLQVLKPVMAAGEIEKRNQKIIQRYRAIVAQVEPRPIPPGLMTRSASGPVTTPHSITASQGGSSPYNIATPFSSNLLGQPQSQLNSPVTVSSPRLQSGFTHPQSTHAAQQFVLQSTNHAPGQPTPYNMQGAQRSPGPGFVEVDEQMIRFQQQLGQLRYQQQSLQQPLQPPAHLGQHNFHQSPLQPPPQRPQTMYSQQSNQADLRARSITPLGQSTFANAAAQLQHQAQLQAPLQTSAMARTMPQPVPQNGPARQLMKPSNRRLIVPNRRITTEEMPRDPSEAKALRMSLHQANVRSPKRVVTLANVAEPGRYYQAAKASFPVRPTAIAPENRVQEVSFDVTPEQYSLISRSVTKQGELLPIVEHFDGSLRWRVRCCKFKLTNEAPTEEQWCATDMSWPPSICMTFNGKVLDIRRKSHNGRDLAAELTDMVVTGKNILKVVLPGQKRTKADSWFLAVEVLETLSHEKVMEMVQNTGLLDADKTLEIIRSRINRPIDDDGVIFNTSGLSIDLADPFSAVIFKIPARGKHCTHLECFDLENFLATRLPSKAARSCNHQYVKCDCPSMPEPSNPDKWRCPICSRDARPCSLRIDGFLLKVRAELEAQNKLRAKSMEVDADGKWEVAVESDDELGDSDDEGQPPVKKRAAPVPRKEKEVVVIELD